MSMNTDLSESISEVQVQQLVKELWGIDVASSSDLGSYIDQNFLIETVEGQKYVLKAHDTSEHEAVLALQNTVLSIVSDAIPSVQFPTSIESAAGRQIEAVDSRIGAKRYLRLLSYVPGKLLGDFSPIPHSLYRDLGQLIGDMDSALLDFYHPVANRPDIPWDLKNAAISSELTHNIGDKEIRRIAEYFFLQFENEVQPNLTSLRKSVVHNDVHRNSVLVDDAGHNLAITGIFDFGDAVYTHTVFNIATAAACAVLNQDEPILAAAELVGAYHHKNPLTDLELSLLFNLLCTRLSIYISQATYQAKSHPDNQHSQSKKDSVEVALQKMIATSPDFALAEFRKACGLAPVMDVEATIAEQQQRRGQFFPKSLYTHYDDALYLTRGSLQFLHAADGKTYLDCVNNVCQWGHAHPHITKAARKQMARLNTNSRYIYDVMTEYAERLTATMPNPLSVCFFVNSGSEANDLAMRLARTYTGRNDVMIIDKAYHGNSTTCTEISPHRIDRPGKPGLPGHVHKVVTPDTYRGSYKRDDKRAGEKYGADAQRVIDQLAEDGKGVAAFIAESLIGTGGQIVLPDGYLKTIYQTVRNQGGICIADEVQVGFGRIGTHNWCFETQGVVPDIVTMGKPMGNGHPMAAVVTTPEIAAAFDGGVTYFNTFGGNPVSCATGLAVLDVLQEEELKQNVINLSYQLVSGLHDIQSRLPCIGDITGLGLYIGVELISDGERLTPATAMAADVVERMKAEGILLNTNGYDNNIIKIKPPLIINDRDISRLLNTLESVLQELSKKEY